MMQWTKKGRDGEEQYSIFAILTVTAGYIMLVAASLCSVQYIPLLIR